MEKIKITIEQEKALKDLGKGFMNIEQKWVNFLTSPVFIGGLEPLNDFTSDQFALLLLGWYEVEQPFKVGDWIYDTEDKKYYKIVEAGKLIDHKRETFLRTCYKLPGITEKVTEPYKIMLLELGRKKPEFATGDKYSTDDGNHYTIKTGQHVIECIQFFEKGLVEYFYPVESRIESRIKLS